MTIATAIRAIAAHLRKFSTMMAVDLVDRNAPTPEQRTAHRAAVEKLCDALDALADQSPTLAQFDGVMQQLYAINAVPPLALVQPVYDALRARDEAAA